MYEIDCDVFHVAGETFVQPQVIPPRHRHQITKPLSNSFHTASVSFQRATAYSIMLSALYAIVHPSVRPSVRPSVCHTGGSVKNG